MERDGREPHREDCQGDGGHQGGGDEGVGAPHLPEAGDRAATRKRCHAGEEDGDASYSGGRNRVVFGPIFTYFLLMFPRSGEIGIGIVREDVRFCVVLYCTVLCCARCCTVLYCTVLGHGS